MLPDLLSLTLLVRATDLGSLSQAARETSIAVAAASRRISTLEARYRVKLLVRTTHGVRPTPAGKALVAHARTILEHAEEARTHLLLFAKGVKGHLRLEANTSAITQFLPADLAQFAIRYPGIVVNLEESRSEEIVERLRDGKSEVGIVMDGIDRDGLVCHEYRRDRLVAVVPDQYPLAAECVQFSDIIEHDLVGLDESAALTRLLQREASSIGEALRLRVQVRSFDAVSRLVQAGMGVGILPELAAEAYVQNMGLRLIRLSDPWAERTMHVCVRQSGRLPPEAWKLIDQLVGQAGVRKMRNQG